MKKKILAFVLVSCMLLGGCTNGNDSSSTDIASVELESNQKIAGNELTYTVAEEVDDSNVSSPSASNEPSSDSDKSSTEGQSSQSNGSSQSNQQSQSDNQGSGNFDMQGGSPPDMNQSGNTGMQGGTPPDMNQSGNQGGFDSSSGSGSSGDSGSGSKSDKSNQSSNAKKSKTMYTLTEESDTLIIPVGTSVITSLGNQTTFSRLSNGDVVKMIIEMDDNGNKVIVGVWMV